jgi:uncharacterized phage protein (TIGR02220 family)
MDAICFIKELNKKGKIYKDVWLHLLLKYEENKPIAFNVNVKFDTVSASTYYRIVDYGISIFPNFFNNYQITKQRGELIIFKKQEEVKPMPIKQKVKIVVKPKDDVIKPMEIYQEIITYLNECTGQKYRVDSKATNALIDSRLKEGFTVEDFKQVIFTKSKNWLNTKWQPFLRPITLFSNKFESYLNEISFVEKNKQEENYDTVSQATELGWND